MYAPLGKTSPLLFLQPMGVYGKRGKASNVEQSKAAWQCMAKKEEVFRSRKPKRGIFLGEIIRVLLADDHRLFRQGITALLEHDPEIKVVGEAENGEEAVKMAELLKPDAVLMDIQMPHLDGFEATQRIKQILPNTAVLILSHDDSPKQLAKALEAGANGYLLKSADFSEVAWAVKTAKKGEIYLTPRMTGALVKGYRELEGKLVSASTPLSPREEEILKLIAEGLTSTEIAKRLSISVKTVQTHRAHILEKLNLHNSVELIQYAIKHGLIDLPQD
jgi:two-component system response regulator NreC